MRGIEEKGRGKRDGKFERIAKDGEGGRSPLSVDRVMGLIGGFR